MEKSWSAKIEELKEVLKADELAIGKKQLEEQMSSPAFWIDREKAAQVSKKASFITETLDKIAELEKLAESSANTGRIEELYEELRLQALFSGKYDRNNALLSIYAGAGGTDAQDWAEMLLRMYLRYAESKNWKTEIIEISPGQEAGIKYATILIEGPLAYGHLKAERGVHRLVRISPFDAEKMRHTSFAMAQVMPELEDDADIDIDEKDLRIDTFKSGGHGGQGVNTTDSAVRITHLPTGIVAACQNERSQAQNKETAFKILKSKLKRYFEAEKEDEKKEIRGEFTDASWGNQIRSYVLHPYHQVKDHRTGFTVEDTDKVLDGDLDGFIFEELKDM
ncbi:MAG TPA: peptide chain release factor 2 [Candidatus Bipolaricaulota bacterium]|nr:peptide chain release factor 2 [Candidatus Bipolaricaulota bacterium]